MTLTAEREIRQKEKLKGGSVNFSSSHPGRLAGTLSSAEVKQPPAGYVLRGTGLAARTNLSSAAAGFVERRPKCRGQALMGAVCLHQDLGEKSDGKVCEVKL